MAERVRDILGDYYEKWVLRNANEPDDPALRERVGDPRALPLAKIILEEQLDLVVDPRKREKAQELKSRVEPMIQKVSQRLSDPNPTIRFDAIDAGTKILTRAVKIYQAKSRGK